MEKEKITDKDKLIKKLSFKNVMLDEELKKRDEEIKRLNTMNEYNYVENMRKGYEQIISALTKEKKELNGAIVGLKARN
jgi:predicted nuclease with TOPRIM domain